MNGGSGPYDPLTPMEQQQQQQPLTLGHQQAQIITIAIPAADWLAVTGPATTAAAGATGGGVPGMGHLPLVITTTGGSSWQAPPPAPQDFLQGPPPHAAWQPHPHLQQQQQLMQALQQGQQPQAPMLQPMPGAAPDMDLRASAPWHTRQDAPHAPVQVLPPPPPQQQPQQQQYSHQHAQQQ